MPQPPHVDGLPLWLQVVATLLFGIATLAVGLNGYFKRDRMKPENGSTVQLSGAAIADMGAIRHLSDVCALLSSNVVELSGNIDGLERTMREQTYHDREHNELLRELCQRLRELRERLDRGSHLSP